MTKKMKLRPGSAWVCEIADTACQLLNISPITLFERQSAYACAMVTENSTRYITYNPERIGTLHSIDEGLAAVVILQAVGHHYNAYRFNRNSAPDEWDAFRTAGWLAHQMGYDFTTCMVIFDMPRFRSSGKYPMAGETRKMAFRAGWRESADPVPGSFEFQKPALKRKAANGVVAGLSVAAGLLLLAAVFRQ